jgi:hypothetical protein
VVLYHKGHLFTPLDAKGVDTDIAPHDEAVFRCLRHVKAHGCADGHKHAFANAQHPVKGMHMPIQSRHFSLQQQKKIKKKKIKKKKSKKKNSAKASIDWG